MNTLKSIGLAVLVVGVVSPICAANYSDATGETINGGILDIVSVDVNNTATALTFMINLAGDPVATDWGKYLIGIDSIPGGDAAGNGWARPIAMSSGMDFFVGGWVDFGNGAEIRKWDGVSWGFQSATYNPNPDNLGITKDSASVTIVFDFAGLGLAAGNSFNFDVYTSGGGGGDSAIDALANPAQSVANWGDPYDSGVNVYSYTIQTVPEPTIGALLGLGLLFFRRRFAR